MVICYFGGSVYIRLQAFKNTVYHFETSLLGFYLKKEKKKEEEEDNSCFCLTLGLVN